MNTNVEIAARELTADELELASGGTIVLEEAAPPPYPPGPSMNAPMPYPPGPSVIGPEI